MGYLDKIKLAQYSRREDWLNSISHMVGGGLSVVALLLCLVRAVLARRWDYAVLGLVYGLTMIAMYSCSSVYHALRPNRGKRAMRLVDHAMIYPMIAGTITPLAVLVIVPQRPVLGWVLVGVAWAVVAAAVPITLTLFNKTKITQMVLYLALGWMVIVAVKTLWEHFDRTGMWLLVSGGLAYTLGAVLYGIGAKKPYFHSVFHFFVLAGSILHFLSLYLYVFVVK
ncbi:MAG TPA: hemolysin III family protein [Candidatus Fimenecus excrementigallinarum]|uniref:Hemolysin III family protein n=1 Tax=Candidatus Fimenecus excrementigallinarum TaxID=2840816 RepID=A0A9D1IEH0_9FIRM|nr:hemolysin III family protein [Candidatus Fimenecus excrementigallinarum]